MSIAPPQHTKICLSIYIGYESPTIVCYLKRLTDDLFTAKFVDCHFNEIVFPTLLEHELSWFILTLSHLDSKIAQCDCKVRRILNLHNIVDSMPDAFYDIDNVMKSHILAANVPARLEIP